eukprot:scaffold32481_cov19-Tisochrysis_lutea.AAC.1
MSVIGLDMEEFARKKGNLILLDPGCMIAVCTGLQQGSFWILRLQRVSRVLREPSDVGICSVCRARRMSKVAQQPPKPRHEMSGEEVQLRQVHRVSAFWCCFFGVCGEEVQLRQMSRFNRASVPECYLVLCQKSFDRA